MGKYIIRLIEYGFVMVIVGLAWQGLELLLYKEIRPSHVDSVVGIVLVVYIVHYYRSKEIIKELEDKVEKLEKRI